MAQAQKFKLYIDPDHDNGFSTDIDPAAWSKDKRRYYIVAARNWILDYLKREQPQVNVTAAGLATIAQKRPNGTQWRSFNAPLKEQAWIPQPWVPTDFFKFISVPRVATNTYFKAAFSELIRERSTCTATLVRETRVIVQEYAGIEPKRTEQESLRKIDSVECVSFKEPVADLETVHDIGNCDNCTPLQS